MDMEIGMMSEVGHQALRNVSDWIWNLGYLMSQSKELDCLNNVASNMHLLVYTYLYK